MAAKKKDEPRMWLFKEEPDHYPYQQLEADGETIWDEVTNNLALQHLREVNVGDRVLYYHTGKEKAIVGEARVVSGPFPDPQGDNARLVVVRIKPVKRWAHPVTLQRIKQEKRLSGWELVRLPRLSIVPVTVEQWQLLEEMGARRTGAADLE